MNATPAVENFIMTLVQGLRLGVEVTGACTIGIGSAVSLFRFAKALLTNLVQLLSTGPVKLFYLKK